MLVRRASAEPHLLALAASDGRKSDDISRHGDRLLHLKICSRVVRDDGVARLCDEEESAVKVDGARRVREGGEDVKRLGEAADVKDAGGAVVAARGQEQAVGGPRAGEAVGRVPAFEVYVKGVEADVAEADGRAVADDCDEAARAGRGVLKGVRIERILKNILRTLHAHGS